MIKHTVRQTWEMERYPRFCKECPESRTRPYSCHNEFGFEGECLLGYMTGHDMRDFRGAIRFNGCKIETDPNVVITKGENYEKYSSYFVRGISGKR